MDKEIIKDVVEQIINMLTNNVIEDNGSEGFESWCADGEVFELNGVEPTERMKLVERLAPLVDELSNEIDRVIDGE